MGKDRIIKQKKPGPEWDDWGRTGKWQIAGYRIVERDEGPRADQREPRTYMVVDRPWDVMYDHSYGRVSPFFMGLMEKELKGTKCPKCGDVFCPPRAHCWRYECRLEETEWIDMPMEGTLHSFGIMGFGGEAFLDQLPFILAYVRVDGANTMIAAQLTGIEPEDVECDMRVKIKFIDEPTGNPMDIYFVPDGMPEHSKPEAEKERIREKLKPIKEWVAERNASK